MGVDTRQKRSSAIEVPGIQSYPPADGVSSASDRMHVAGLYSGFIPFFENFFFWRRSNDGQVSWAQSQSAGSAPSAKVSGKNDPWTKVREVRDVS